MKSTTTSELIQFKSKPRWYIIRGSLMIFLGGGIAFMCVVAPNVYMLGENFSWIPVVAVLVFVVGILRCIDAFTAKTVQSYLLNMQGGILDLVFGFLMLFSINDEPANLSLLIVGYMITQGFYRNVIISAANISNPISSRITGMISIVLGLLIWIDWPTSAPWFLALSLAIDVCFRGWALVMLASSIKKEALIEE